MVEQRTTQSQEISPLLLQLPRFRALAYSTLPLTGTHLDTLPTIVSVSLSSLCAFEGVPARRRRSVCWSLILAVVITKSASSCVRD